MYFIGTDLCTYVWNTVYVYQVVGFEIMKFKFVYGPPVVLQICVAQPLTSY